ncbi:breast cancer anti-estrogen resistance protein 1-like isoform X1 [Salvelinus fontinalis]|uniref:Breast cancer anti-estrogen resistance protein 1 n=1 Tax=Salvelinus namaycush TaxID=8040 RepID=A0A8U1H969_SALNM|nr:breast cancer anti-estrogen resistance protein 1-like isoform X1 [Salvelinus namaycush]XP_055790240.1 breast cancer anti-estrogen resistance protein 1-like isoform X1 [Salvelinus fontinalis]
MNYLNVLAKALYDNVAESPDELSFRKGDIMTVLERDTQGLDGWWLCSLHGRQGIVPGNRLKILVGMYDKAGQQQQPPLLQASQAGSAQTPSQLAFPPQSAYTKPSPSSQYTAMHPAFSNPGPVPALPDSIYMMPPNHGKHSPSSLYQIPTGPQAPPKAPMLAQKRYPVQDIYQVPPSMGPAPVQDIYQVPPSARGPVPGQDIYQVPPSLNQTQIPPSIEKRSWDSKPLGKVVVPTRVGQVYVYDTEKSEQDEYDVPPRHMPPSQQSQDIYDVPPTRAQYSQQVYDTPPMAVKGPTSGQDIYDTPPSVDKSQLLSQQTVYDFPPSVSKDVPDAPIREETYDVPPHFAKLKSLESQSQGCLIPGGPEPPIPEDVYDIPPPPLTGKHHPDAHLGQEIYDIPASLRKGGPHDPQDVYDFPRERPAGEDSIYDIPPQVVRDAGATEELTVSFKRLSASSTGSTRSNLSTSSLDMVPVRESAVPSQAGPGKLLILDLDQAMERLSRLQQGVEGSVSLLMSFISGNWRSPTQMEANLPAIRQAVERMRVAVRDLLEFARGAVANSAQATDRTLQAKLGKQVQKMEEAFQGLVKYSQVLDAVAWAPPALMTPSAGSSGDDLDRLVMCARGVPDDTKQLASFLHGNASLLFKRTNKQQQLPLPPVPHAADLMGQMTNNNISAYQMGDGRANIQSRPLPSPPKLTAEEETSDRPYETTEEGWLEDYDYVHLQGKEEFEKNQRQLLEKGTRHNKTTLEQQQLKQFERLEQEVSRPINNDISGWTPPPHYPTAQRSKLSMGDRQLLLFYSEQCESNVTTLTNAIDAFYSSINNNQPPKIFVAHSKFVILSAHKLVFIGDTLSRQAKSPEVRAHVAQHSNTLCDKLKDIVVSTKTAALQYPSPGAARDMTERVRELAGCTQQFRMALGQLVAM